MLKRLRGQAAAFADYLNFGALRTGCRVLMFSRERLTQMDVPQDERGEGQDGHHVHWASSFGFSQADGEK